MLEWKLALRNLSRNKRRTILTALVISVGLTALVFFDGLTRGMTRDLIHSATHTLTGEAQVQLAGFRDDPQVDSVIPHYRAGLELLKNSKEVAAVTARSAVQGMVSSAANQGAVQIYGVDAAEEKKLSLIAKAVVEGDYLGENSKTGGAQEILIGKKLAQDLEVGLGDRVVMTVPQSSKHAKGELAQELFRVSGIFDLGGVRLNQSLVFVHRQALNHALALPDSAHEIAITFHDPKFAADTTLRASLFEELGKKTGGKVEGWDTFASALKAMAQMTDSTGIIMGLILFSVISFGVVNSLLMALHERTFEFGVIRAIGTRPIAVARMILMESLVLGLLSTLAGMIFSAIVAMILSRYGIPFPPTEYSGAVLREPIRLIATVQQFTLFPLFVVVLTTLAGVYPAWVAARIQPVQAMRKSL